MSQGSESERKKLLSRLSSWSKNLPGSVGYWKEQSKDLRAITEEKIQWTTFESYSAADYHWKQLFEMLTGEEKLPSIKERAELVRKHPLFCMDFFKAKWDDFFKRLKKISPETSSPD